MPHHQNISCSRHPYTHTQRNRSHSSYYGLRQERHYSRLQSWHHPHHDRSSSLKRHTSCSSSNHCNSSTCHPSANRWPPIHAMIVTPHHIFTMSPTKTNLATASWTEASPDSKIPITLHREKSKEGLSHAQDHPSIINTPSQNHCHPGPPTMLFIRFK